MWKPAQASLMWTGHYHFHIVIIAMLVTIASDITLNAYVALAAALMWLCIALSVIPHAYHNAHMCLRCSREPPYHNPEKSVRRWHGELRLFHWRYFTAFVLSTIAGMAIELYIAAKLSSMPLWLRFADICLLALLGYAAFTLLTHRRLKIWCPDCNDNGDDGDDDGNDDTLPPTPPATRKTHRVA